MEVSLGTTYLLKPYINHHVLNLRIGETQTLPKPKSSTNVIQIDRQHCTPQEPTCTCSKLF